MAAIRSFDVDDEPAICHGRIGCKHAPTLKDSSIADDGLEEAWLPILDVQRLLEHLNPHEFILMEHL